jgi:hypothetical protein
MPDDDHDYRRGPGQHKSPDGPVIEAYAETDALGRPCPKPPGCGVEKNEFCVFPDGTQRHHPCVIRTKQPQEHRQ